MRTDYDVKQMNINSKNVVVNLDKHYIEDKISFKQSHEAK